MTRETRKTLLELVLFVTLALVAAAGFVRAWNEQDWFWAIAALVPFLYFANAVRDRWRRL